MIHKLKFLGLAILLSLATTTAYSKAAPEITKDKPLIEIVGPIGPLFAQMRIINLLNQANTRKDVTEVNVVINSPGGSVQAGLGIVKMITEGQAKGKTFICYVPTDAESMAMYILGYCNKRYVMNYARLMWHPMAINGRITSDEMIANAAAMFALDMALSAKLCSQLGMDAEAFFEARAAEKVWAGKDLLEHIDEDFMTLVDDMPGMPSEDITGLFYGLTKDH